ncbi:MAG: response regulator, partial [Deltaproteobacteria bacterium]|nr:response regulator [Deltaproteobacteria bacterium]
DDDPDFAELVAMWLEEAFPRSEVVIASNGEEALRLAESQPFAMALIDLDMPGMNGVELSAALKGMPSTAGLPILVATGVGGASDWRLLQWLGVEGVVVKPLDPKSLVALVRRTLKSAEPRA